MASVFPFRGTGYGAAGASLTKRGVKAFDAVSSSPQSDIDDNNMTLRQRCRMLYMSAPIATSAVNTSRTKVVGIGIYPRPAINRTLLGLTEEQAAEWQRKVEAEWRMFAEDKHSVDALGANNFYELQQIALKSWLMSGDVFCLIKRKDPTPMRPYSLRLHLIEADRVSTPNITVLGGNTTGEMKNGNKVYDGVEVDKNGEIVAYHICKSYPDEVLLKDGGWTRIPAIGKLSELPNILHIMEAERPDQYRGVSFLAPIIEMTLQMRRYTESSLVAATIQSYLTAWIIKNAPMPGENPLAGEGLGGVDPSSVPTEESHGYQEQQMGPGNVLVLEEGEDVRFGNPNIPTAGFQDFIKTLATLCGAALEIPYDVLVKEFNASYSASKAALDEAWKTFLMKRAHLVSDFCKPVYEIWLAEAVASGRINAPGFFTDPLIRQAWCGVNWEGPAQMNLDPRKEAEANAVAVSHGWKTNEQVTRENYGGDWHDNIEALKHEYALAGELPGSKEEYAEDQEDE